MPVETLADHVCEQGNPGNREGWSHVEVGAPAADPGRRAGAGRHARASVASARCTARRRWPRCPRRTRCCSCRTPPRSTRRRSWSSCAHAVVGVPERGLRAHQDRPVPGVAAHRRARPRPPGGGRDRRRDVRRLVHAALARRPRQRRRAQRRVGLPGAGRLPAPSGCWVRPTGWPARSTVHDVLAVTGQLAANLRAEQTAQQNPESVRELVGELTEAPGAGRRAQGAVRPLAADPQRRRRRPQRRHRLRPARPDARDQPAGRGRAGSGGDPTKVWDQFVALGGAGGRRRRVGELRLGDASGRAGWPSRSAEHFSADRDQLLPALRTDPSDALRSVRAITVRETEPWSVGNKALTGLRAATWAC